MNKQNTKKYIYVILNPEFIRDFVHSSDDTILLELTKRRMKMKKNNFKKYAQASLMVVFAMVIVLSAFEFSKNDCVAGKHDIPETIFSIAKA